MATASDLTSEIGARKTDRDTSESRAPRKSSKAQEATSALKISTTAPAELRRHNISNKELEMLASENRDGLSEAFWGLVGAAAAALPAAGEAVWKAYHNVPAQPIGPLHLIEIAIVIAASAGAAVLRIVSRGRGGRITRLVNEIRGRQAT